MEICTQRRRFGNALFQIVIFIEVPKLDVFQLQELYSKLHLQLQPTVVSCIWKQDEAGYFKDSNERLFSRCMEWRSISSALSMAVWAPQDHMCTMIFGNV